MMAPEALALAQEPRQPAQAADVVRVALERRGVIGFIEAHDGMTLAQARARIWEEVEDAPPEFQFVLADGAPVSARQEAAQRVGSFYPVLRIRESRGRSAAPPAGPAPAPPASERVCVLSPSGDEFRTWIAGEYTFQQLRRDAARYWHLPAAQVALADAEGCLWPEQARILSVMGARELRERKVVLAYKAGALARGPAAELERPAGSHARRLPAPPAPPPPPPPAPAPESVADGPAESPVEQLWRIFTFYCVTGDSTELESLTAHQFGRLLRDARALGGGLTPAMADIIYLSETKGKARASARMSFAEFQRALAKAAVARRLARGAGSRRLRAAEDEDALCRRLVAGRVLPLAARWPARAWGEQTARLRRPEVVALVSKFLEPLLEVFLFYARSHAVHPVSGVKEFFMSYADYQRFANDFSFSSLQLSSVEAAQVFVAACASPPFHAPLFADGDDRAGADDASSSAGAGGFAAAVQRLLEGVEGLAAYAFPENQVGRVCMGVSAFLDALGRVGLAAFAKARPLRTVQCVKGVLHHLSRGLTRSRVLEILRNHGAMSVRATKFYSATVAFNNKFLDMWRCEGSPDYLTGDSLAAAASPSKLSEPPAGDSTATKSGAGGSVGGELPVAASQTLGVATGAARKRAAALRDNLGAPVAGVAVGRGREVLERLARSSSQRDTAAAARQVANEGSSEAAAGSVTDSLGGKGVDSRTGDLASSEAGELEESETRDPALVRRGPGESAEAEKQLGPASSAGGAAAAVAPPAPLARDDRGFYEGVLFKGGVFKKYGQWGSPHRRFVWLGRDADALFWRPVNKKNALAKEGVAVAAVAAVLPGSSARTRYAFMKHLSDERALCRCFSIVAEDRRLDLEADSEATRETWMRALLFLVKERRAAAIIPQ